MLEVIAEQRGTQAAFVASTLHGHDAQALAISSASHSSAKGTHTYVALLFHKFELESESQCDQEGRIHFQLASPWLFQMHQDFDKLLSVVDDLSLDANVIDQRFRAMFSTHEPDT